MDIKEKLIKQVKNCKYKILLPEAKIDKRIYNAAKLLMDVGINVVVIGKPKDFGDEFKTNHCTFISRDDVDLNAMANSLYVLRKAKGLTPQGAYELLQNDECFA